MPIDLQKLRHIRSSDPDAIVAAAQARRRPAELVPPDGRLFLVAADHPARGSLAALGQPMAMADRGELLDRLVTALARPGVDGILATADLCEDLLLLGALEGKVVIGSMNRGGLAGSSFEFDDRFTAYDADAIASMGFEGGKMLTRINLADGATVDTLEASARAVNELADRGLMAMVEPFMSEWTDGGMARNVLTPEAVMRSMAIASGLGRTTRHTWLKLPVVDDMERVMQATSLPTLLLGGDPVGEGFETTLDRWTAALSVPGVMGLVVGRSLLYPVDGDVERCVDGAARVVHGGP